MNKVLLDAFWAAVRRNLTGELCMDDVTDSGRIALDPTHTANKGQNGLGHVLPYAARQGWVVKTDRSVQSKAPGRKGGRQLLWEITPAAYAIASRMP
jgi:hypothetical protein